MTDTYSPAAHAALGAVFAPMAIEAAAAPDTAAAGLKGRVVLDTEALRLLRQTRLMSQQDLADDCWRRNIRVSIATIKRAESGRAVRFRIARELARCFDVPVVRLVRA